MTREPPFFVYVVESPSPEDFLAERREGSALAEALKQANIPVVYKIAVNYEMFSEALKLNSIKHEQERRQKEYNRVLLPILHLSTHGNKEGIGFTSGQIISWKALRELVLPIYRFLKSQNLDLIMCISSCESSEAIRMVSGGDDIRIPFAVMVVNEGKPTWAETVTAFITFYHLLAKMSDREEVSNFEVSNLVEAMTMASGNKQFKFITHGKAKLVRILAKSPGGSIYRKF